MASKSERTIVEALGIPDGTTKVSFTDSPVSGFIDGEELFRFAATEDCYMKMTVSGVAHVSAVGTSDMILFAGIPEIFQTGANSSSSNATQVNVIRKDTSGDLLITKMKSPKK